MMNWLATLTGYIAPLFLILSPIISYGDQAVSMQRNKTSAGFSLDIPLIMLVASLFRCVFVHEPVQGSAVRPIRRNG
ncbi:hypothetical protein THARTR1_04779 [Trichoderma harzianum]|uniref:Uncharacterized protein n=1 Tax=Trichoderma harzianum TaxID=5544 RepID=A0A2K0UBD4_TRIHA|nr:hypothetical protein THARTR1_04779 [Trichoderma harzianum]